MIVVVVDSIMQISFTIAGPAKTSSVITTVDCLTDPADSVIAIVLVEVTVSTAVDVEYLDRLGGLILVTIAAVTSRRTAATRVVLTIQRKKEPHSGAAVPFSFSPTV